MRAPPTEATPAQSLDDYTSSRQENRRQAVVMVALSYAADGVLLAGYCHLGVTAWPLLVAYLVAAALQCIGFHHAVASGWSKRFRDPSLAPAQMAVGGVIQIVFIALAPQALPVFGFATLSLLSFATLQLPLRGSLLSWGLMAAGIGVTFALGNERFQVPVDTPFARFLLVIGLLLALLRCTLIGSFGVRIREMIQRRQLLVEANALHLDDLAKRDALTGALNRRGILDLAQAACDRAAAGGAGFSVAMIDLDHFKAVNDVHGHLTGDAVLKMASQCIAGALRNDDLMGRYGGEEFLVLMHGAADAEPALRAAERVLRAFPEQPWATLAPGLAQTASIGVSAHRPGERIEETLARADEALYRCKDAGRNTVRMG